MKCVITYHRRLDTIRLETEFSDHVPVNGASVYISWPFTKAV